MLTTVPLRIPRGRDPRKKAQGAYRDPCSGDPDSQKNELGFHKVANYCLLWKLKRGKRGIGSQ